MTTSKNIKSAPMTAALVEAGASPNKRNGHMTKASADWSSCSASVGGDWTTAAYFASAPRNRAAVTRKNAQRAPAAIRGNASPPAHARTETITNATCRWGASTIRHCPNAAAINTRRSQPNKPGRTAAARLPMAARWREGLLVRSGSKYPRDAEIENPSDAANICRIRMLPKAESIFAGLKQSVAMPNSTLPPNATSVQPGAGETVKTKRSVDARITIGTFACSLPAEPEATRADHRRQEAASRSGRNRK